MLAPVLIMDLAYSDGWSLTSPIARSLPPMIVNINPS